jgi:hypothetical protein
MYSAFRRGLFMPLALMSAADRIPDKSTRFLVRPEKLENSFVFRDSQRF